MKTLRVLMMSLILFLPFLSTTTTSDIIRSHDHQVLFQDTEYWGVIVGIADYDGIQNDLPVTQRHMKLLYDVLISKPNWQEDHIKLLLNENAKRDDILEAIEWLQGNADADDIVLFSFQGHGSSIEDIDGDELDGKDEGIVAWEGQTGLITDDELDEKFDDINCLGMMLIFHSCLSGGLADLSETGRLFSITTFSSAFTNDLEGQNRVIVTSSMDHGLALAYPSLTRQIAYGLQGNADDDPLGKPGYLIISAEEAANYGINQVKKIFMLIFLLYPPAIISFICASIIARLKSGYWILPVPQFFDGFEGELSIVESI